ncbi:MAG: hypothetical protein LUH82_05170, partial [Clostridiales bacterium]|nr:hypothetical protein [Clostridiales bacterium]
MADYKIAVEKAYDQLNDSVILGLTGRTGSGCSTAAKILEKHKFSDLDLSTPKKKDFLDIEERKNAIVYKYMETEWKPFTTIEVSSVIMSFVFERTFKEFKSFLNSLCEGSEGKNFHIAGYDELIGKLNGLESLFSNKKIKIDSLNDISDNKLDEYYEYYVTQVKKQKAMFFNLFSQFSCYESAKSNFEKNKERKSQLYTYLLQLFGNNIRSSGNPFDSDFNKKSFNDVTKRVRYIIEVIKQYNKVNGKKTRICIDAIRNPYEAYYLRDLYREFYLVSVSTNDSDRIIRLKNFDQEQLDSLDNMEYPNNFEDGKIFYQQSIKECLQISDIHLYNPGSSDGTYELLTTNLVRYVALMLHPGLITPTNIERCMQVAFNAKFNSGCLSRQVGAVITDDKFYIKAIGWNEVPQGQISCGLRSVENYFSDRDVNTFSKFELENMGFKNALRNIKAGYLHFDNIYNKYNLSYCFKDIYNAINNDKNQVYTRSLHAEENAFLQVSKFGGQGIKGGKLFVTASPCELCSKKSYQLGIKDIYYIDPYPGIAASHILKLGQKDTNPNLHIFYGAVGNAYVSLYMQRFAVKDELQLLTGIEPKKEAIKEKHNYKRNYKDNEFKSIALELVFNNRSDVDFYQKATLIPKAKPLTKIEKTLNWTGSHYDKTIINNDNKTYSIKEENIYDGKYNLLIILNDECPINKEFSYDIKTIVNDEQKIVNPLLAHHVKAITKELTLIVKFKKTQFRKKPRNTKLNLYADMNNNVLYSTEELELELSNDGFYYIKKQIDNPCLLYTYAI